MERKGATPKFCTECGQPLSKGVSYCTNCGTKVPVVQGEDAATAEISGGPLEAAGSRMIELPEVRKTPSFETVLESGKMDAITEAQADREAAQRAYAALYGDAAPAYSGEEAAAAGCAEDAPGGAFGVESASDGAPQNRSKKRKTLFIGVSAVASAAIVGALAFAGVFSGAPSDSSAEAPAAEEQAASQPDSAESSASEDLAPVELSERCTTRFGEANQVTFPAFEFKYPAGWTVVNDQVSSDGESIDLRKDSDGTVVSFQQWSSLAHAGGTSVEFADAERVGDVFFVPEYVQATDCRDLGSFGVMRGSLLVNGVENGMVYAVLPDKALSDPDITNTVSGLPGFKYGSPIAFACLTSMELDAQTEHEVIAILGSFALSDSASDPVKKTSEDYVLPESATRVYTEEELASMSDYELYIARNEIFARHGRMFNSADLKTHFASKSWYTPSIAPEDFDESALNPYERKNVETIYGIEQDRGSSYIG